MKPGKLLFLFLSLIPSSHLVFIPTFPLSFFSPTPCLSDVAVPPHPFISTHPSCTSLTGTEHHSIRFRALAKLVRRAETWRDSGEGIHNRKYSGDTKTQRRLRFDIGAEPHRTHRTSIHSEPRQCGTQGLKGRAGSPRHD